MTPKLASRQWSFASADPALVQSLQVSTGLSEVTARILVSRGLTDAEQVKRFLEPSLERDWLDPSLIPGMSSAAECVAAAVRAGRRILVFGDFDLDGVSAAAVAARGLTALGADVSAIVPHRFTEGYGLSAAAIRRVLTYEAALVVTVDCGISSSVEVADLVSRGIDVVVTDHHEPGEFVPADVPVANPKLDPACPSCDLSGAGVALKLVDAVGRLLGRPEVWRELTDLATLGTVADIVPLRDENRALVADGVQRLRTSPRVALAALAAVARVSPETLSSDGIAFGLAPRLNAAGRMADPQVSLDLLLCDDPVEAERLALALDEHNRVRQAAEAELAEAAITLAERVYAGERAIVLAGEGWHEGVKGIVASRLVNRYRVPVILFSIEEGIAKGSGRSVGEVDLFEAVDSCSSLLERFGGHRAAVGLTLAEGDLEPFRDRLLAHLDTLPAEAFVSASAIDAELRLDEVSVELGAELALLEPFGHSNPRPVLAARSVFMNGRQRVGKTGNHLKFTAFDGVASVPAIAFRCEDIDQVAETESPMDIAFQIEVDEWRGRTRAQLVVREIVAAEVSDDAPAAALVEDLFQRADEILAREEYAGIEDAPSFHTKLAGVTFEGRQEVLARLAPGAPLRLVRQPDNPHDSNAVAVLDPHGAQVGYLNRRLAGVLATPIDAGVEYDVEVTEVTGGEADRSLGVNVLLTRRDASAEGMAAEELRARTRAELSALSAEQLEAELVRRFIGDRALHDAQVRALAELSAGRNTLAVMATGRGKSLIFHLHAARSALRKNLASVFVYPLRALVADQAFHLTETFDEVGLRVATITGETPLGERDDAFEALRNGGLDVVLTTPEFLHFHSARFAAAERVRFVVVDEAHHVGLSRAGHRPAYARLDEAIEAMGRPLVLAVSATVSDDMCDQVRGVLGIEAVILDPTVRENLIVEDKRSGREKDDIVRALAGRGEKVVIYVNSRDKSVQLARMLRKRLPELAFKVAFYNGGLSRSVRHAVEKAFRNSELQVVVATSAFGEGVNIPDIRHVVLYHLPFNDVEFNQMAGRAGRDGAAARIHLVFGERDAQINQRILSASAPRREDLVALYRVLRTLQETQGDGFEITNAELAERARKIDPSCTFDEKGVSAGLGVFRELGLVTGEGHGAYRRLTLDLSASKVDLESSVRYSEGLDEIREFEDFRVWALTAGADELLHRFNRPILPTTQH